MRTTYEKIIFYGRIPFTFNFQNWNFSIFFQKGQNYIIPIFRNKGSNQDMNNFRPISLLSSIDTIFKKKQIILYIIFSLTVNINSFLKNDLDLENHTQLTMLITLIATNALRHTVKLVNSSCPFNSHQVKIPQQAGFKNDKCVFHN